MGNLWVSKQLLLLNLSKPISINPQVSEYYYILHAAAEELNYRIKSLY